MRQFLRTFWLAILISFLSGIASVFTVGFIRSWLRNRREAKRLSAVNFPPGPMQQHG